MKHAMINGFFKMCMLVSITLNKWADLKDRK